TAPEPVVVPPEPLTPPAVHHILVVEDHPTNAMLVQDILRHWGYEVHHVEDGLEALAWLVSHSIDLVLLDIHLPGLDGFEVAHRMRNHPQLKHIPIIATTALAMVGDRDRCLKAGMQGYISKPIDYEELAALLTQYTQGEL
ncbi:MAG TPA: response regulator, partial [Candidatus Obscuribacterales bacterium]